MEQSVSLNFDMVNQVPLTFFATFKSKAAKQLKEVVSQNEIHYTTITANLFESSQMHPGIHFHKGVRGFPSFFKWGIYFHHHFEAILKARLSNHQKTVFCKIKSIIQLSLPTCLQFYKCFHVFIWKIEHICSFNLDMGNHFHQNFQEIFNARLSENWKTVFCKVNQ